MSLVVSVLTGGTGNHQTTSEEANGVYTDFVSEGIVGTIGNTSGVAPATGGFAVNAQGTPDMTVAVSAGVAYVQGTPSSQNAQTFRVKNSASTNVTISANSSGSTKYDWLYISLDATNLNTPNTAGDNVASLTTSRSSSASTDDGTPPTYGYAIAVITVANGASTITNSVIRDVRAASTISNGTSNVSAGWNSLGYTPNTVTYNGNRSYSLVFNSTDLTSTLSNGMRVNTTRTVSAPTQCTSLNGTTQYYSKSSPAGLSFTAAFTCSAWVKLTSYAAGGIIARRNADTEGFSFGVNASGQVTLGAYRIASNNKVGVSYQSLPLNKWVHVAASMDVTSGSTSAATLIYIDGILVPALTTTTGTCTALVQGTTALVVGAEKSAGTNPFPGSIAQAAVYSAIISAATIAASSTQTLAGTETNLVSAYSFNNSINDLNANANNLSAQGSAVATAADSPFAQDDAAVPTGTTDYGIVQSCTFSTNTTLVVQVPEGNTIPTSGGVASMQYAVVNTPFAFPRNKNRFQIVSLWKKETASTSNATYGSFSSAGWQLVTPIGSWLVGYDIGFSSTSTTRVTFNVSATSITGNAQDSGDTSLAAPVISATNAAGAFMSYTRRIPVTTSTALTYLMYSVGSTTGAVVEGDSSLCQLIAENAYL